MRVGHEVAGRRGLFRCLAVVIAESLRFRDNARAGQRDQLLYVIPRRARRKRFGENRRMGGDALISHEHWPS
jgi:hypothetical protein